MDTIEIEEIPGVLADTRDLLVEIRDLLRSLDERSSRAERGIARITPALTEAARRAMTNPKVRKLIGDK